MKEQAKHRTDRHGKVVCQPVIAQSFAPPCRGHNVDDYRISAYRDHSERDAVDDAVDDEHGQRSGKHVSGKNHREDKVSEEVEGFAGESVEQVSGEGADAE